MILSKVVFCSVWVMFTYKTVPNQPYADTYKVSYIFHIWIWLKLRIVPVCFVCKDFTCQWDDLLYRSLPMEQVTGRITGMYVGLRVWCELPFHLHGITRQNYVTHAVKRRLYRARGCQNRVFGVLIKYTFFPYL